MRRLAIALLLPLGLWAEDLPKPVPASGAEAVLEESLPANAALTVLIRNVPGLLDRWGQSAPGKAWEDAQFRKFLAPLRKGMRIDAWDEELKAKTGRTLKELLELFPGSAAISLALPENPGRGAQPRLALIGDIGDNGKDVEEALGKLAEGRREATEEFKGETLHLVAHAEEGEQGDAGAWAIVRETLLVATDRETLENAVQDRLAPVGKPLSGLPAFQKARARNPESDVLAFGNLVPMMDALHAALTAQIPPQNPMGITAEGIVGGLGLDVLQAAFASARFSAGECRIDAGLLYKEPKGLVKLLAFEPGPCPRPDFLCPEAVAFGASRFSPLKAFEAFEEILNAVSPGLAAMFQMGVTGKFAANAGVDLKGDLLKSLGGELSTCEVPAPPAGPGQPVAAPDTLYALAVADREKVDAAFDGILAYLAQQGQAPEFEKREYLGTTVHSSSAPVGGPAGRILHYAVTDKQLLVCVGGPGPLEAAIAAMAKPGKSVWDRPDAKALLAGFEGQPCALSFADTGKALVETLKQLAQAGPGMMPMRRGLPGAPGLCDPAALPGEEAVARYFGPGASACWIEPTGYFIRSILTAPPPAP